MEDWLQKIKNYRYALIGFPEDRGIQRNNGRPGAAQGPSKIRTHLNKPDLKKWGLVDLGDTPPAETLLERQRLLGSMVRLCLEENVSPIVLGGGHETAFGHYLGYKKEGLHVLNIDAHLDCRPLVDGEGHSGSPFRQMIEAGLSGENLTEFGIQRDCNSGANVEFAIEKRVKIVELEEIRHRGLKTSLQQILVGIKGPLYATIDLDSLSPLEFPATSAAWKMKEGFSVAEMLLLVEIIASHPSLTSLDLVEYSPPFDQGGACAKAVALILYRFLVERGKSHAV